jgi:hypothetical protein
MGFPPEENTKSLSGKSASAKALTRHTAMNFELNIRAFPTFAQEWCVVQIATKISRAFDTWRCSCATPA